MLLGAAAVVTMLVASKGLWGIVTKRYGFEPFATRRPSPNKP